MTEAIPNEPLLIRTDSAWTMAGGLLLLQGYRPDVRWESGDLWRRWATALRGRDPAHQVFLQKVKAHVDESHFARGIITQAEAEGNERADELP